MDPANLCYYYKKGLQPFHSIMDLPEAELIAFMEMYLPEERVFHKDPSGYIAKRRETESWLYSAFRQKGGLPASTKPIYLTLGPSSYIESLGVYTELLQIPLSVFSAESVSFTYTDSYVSRWLAETRHECFNPSLHGRVFTLQEMLSLLSGKRHVHGQATGPNRYDFFVEAQVWDDKPLQTFRPSNGSTD